MEFLELSSPDEYFQAFRREYIKEKLFTEDGLRVKFRSDRFAHDFYTCSGKDCFEHRHDWKCDKDKFDLSRAKRMLWIGRLIRGDCAADVRRQIDQYSRKEMRIYIYEEDDQDPFAVVLRRINDESYAFSTAFCPKKHWIEKIEKTTKKITIK
jgi:hypothetical protein